MKKHGLTRKTSTPEQKKTYKAYENMISRCYNPKHLNFKTYGAKGITVCEEWLDKSQGIFNFLKDLGIMPSTEYQIHRKKSKDNYTLENTMWLEKDKHNILNKRNHEKITELTLEQINNIKQQLKADTQDKILLQSINLLPQIFLVIDLVAVSGQTRAITDKYLSLFVKANQIIRIGRGIYERREVNERQSLN